jgi:two-component system OmpR family response regulator
MRLLLVEDDVKLVRVLERGLTGEGYAVDVAYTGDDALRLALASDYDAVVLDVMLPGPDGFSVCRQMRSADRRSPVLMLTARTDVSDRIRGLDAGADDYLVKPFDFGELVARLRALRRRATAEPPAPVGVAGLELDPETRVVTREGREVELTAREYDVLEVLALSAGQVVARAELLERVWKDDPGVSLNIVDVYVGYLRRKLDGPAAPSLIRTVRGVGFLLESP